MIAKYKNGVAEWATHMFCRLLLISIPLTGFASPAPSRRHVVDQGDIFVAQCSDKLPYLELIMRSL